MHAQWNALPRSLNLSVEHATAWGLADWGWRSYVSPGSQCSVRFRHGVDERLDTERAPMPPFSQRYRHRPSAVPPSELIRDDAPEGVRAGFLAIFENVLYPGGLRDVVCAVLRKRPDPENWSPYPNLWNEVQELVYRAPWPKFYDVVEAALAAVDRYDRTLATEQLNDLFAEEGLAWHVVDGEVVLRTGDVTDEVVAYAVEGLQETGRPTAAAELEKAIAALSLRPQADTRDAVRFAAGAMEALARDITGDRNATLGEILKKHGNTLLSPPLKIAFEKVWGFCGDTARHVDEQKAPMLDEAILVVGLVGAAVAFLARKT